MKPGAYDGIPNAQYHGGPGISKSGLDVIHRSPLHFKALRDKANDDKPAPTSAQIIGSAFHALVLEPEVFRREYCLALRPSDIEGVVVDGKDQLLAMIREINSKRRPKLSSSGSKSDLMARIRVEAPDSDVASQALEDFSLAELKTAIDIINGERLGLLSESGTIEELAIRCRGAGAQFQLWASVKEEWARNNAHLTVLKQEEWDQVHAMRDAVMAHPAARALLTGAQGVAERSVYWRDPSTGELCRCRPDWWRIDGIVVDLKSTDDASPEEFARSILNWRYHVQHPYYLDGIEHARVQAEQAKEAARARADEWPEPAQGTAPIWPAKHFTFVAVEKKPPYAVAVYVLDPTSVEVGRIEYRRDLDLYGDCQRSGTWPGYGDKLQPISLPRWHVLNVAPQLVQAA